MTVLGNVPKDVQRPIHVPDTQTDFESRFTLKEHPDFWDEEFALFVKQINMLLYRSKQKIVISDIKIIS